MNPAGSNIFPEKSKERTLNEKKRKSDMLLSYFPLLKFFN